MMKAIFERRSVRKYTDQPVPPEEIELLLKAAMAAPSAGNEQPWHFIVIRDKEIMKQIMEVHPYSSMLKYAPVAIAVCGDLQLEKYDVGGLWVHDCCAATENILLAAQDRGLGAVWLAVHPYPERITGFARILNLPEHVKTLSLVAFGYPMEKKPAADRYKPDRVHRERWDGTR